MRRQRDIELTLLARLRDMAGCADLNGNTQTPKGMLYVQDVTKKALGEKKVSAKVHDQRPVPGPRDFRCCS